MNNDTPHEPPALETEIPEAWNKHRPVLPAPWSPPKRPDAWNTWHMMAGLGFVVSVLAWMNSGAAYLGGGLVICLLLVIIGELNEIKRRP